MTRVRQNDTALPPFPRQTRPYDEVEGALVRMMARGGQTAPSIVEKLAERGFVRTEASVACSMVYLTARRERREARADEDAARRAGVPSDVPYDRLPAVSIQAGCVSHPEPWAR